MHWNHKKQNLTDWKLICNWSYYLRRLRIGSPSIRNRIILSCAKRSYSSVPDSVTLNCTAKGRPGLDFSITFCFGITVMQPGPIRNPKINMEHNGRNSQMLKMTLKKSSFASWKLQTTFSFLVIYILCDIIHYNNDEYKIFQYLRNLSFWEINKNCLDQKFIKTNL